MPAVDRTPSSAADTGEPEAIERPSKTRLKKASHDLQTLGEALAGLPEQRLAALPMPESLLEALREWKHTRSREGRRRQLQYIGKLMRGVDAEPLREAVAESQLGSARAALALHRAERWRTELLAGDEAATRWGAEHPQGDLQQLRQLVRNARRDAASAPELRSGRAYRELFRFIREHIDDD